MSQDNGTLMEICWDCKDKVLKFYIFKRRAKEVQLRDIPKPKRPSARHIKSKMVHNIVNIVESYTQKCSISAITIKESERKLVIESWDKHKGVEPPPVQPPPAQIEGNVKQEPDVDMTASLEEQFTADNDTADNDESLDESSEFDASNLFCDFEEPGTSSASLQSRVTFRQQWNERGEKEVHNSLNNNSRTDHFVTQFVTIRYLLRIRDTNCVMKPEVRRESKINVAKLYENLLLEINVKAQSRPTSTNNHSWMKSSENGTKPSESLRVYYGRSSKYQRGAFGGCIGALGALRGLGASEAQGGFGGLWEALVGFGGFGNFGGIEGFEGLKGGRRVGGLKGWRLKWLEG